MTIDPARDTAAVMHRFLARFGRPALEPARRIDRNVLRRSSRVKTAYHVWSQTHRPSKTLTVTS